MVVRFALICAAVVVILGGLAGSADAQIVAISNVNYKVAAGMDPATAEPQGTFSIPAAGTYQIVYDYGTINNGTFTATPNVSAGGTATFAVIKVPGNRNWSATGPNNLTNPPMGLYCRARLQRHNGTAWVDDNTTYAPCP